MGSWDETTDDASRASSLIRMALIEMEIAPYLDVPVTGHPRRGNG